MALSDKLPKDTQAHLAVCVGEASGDWIAAEALAPILRQHPDLLCEGIAGPRLRALGVTALHASEDLSVRGYVEVLAHLPRLLRMRSRLIERWSKVQPPRLFLGVDAPDFNLKLEAKVKAAGIPTVHMVCPSIWAWRGERVHQLKTACDHVLCVFPFEPALLHGHGIAATYIGHPLAQLVPKVIDPTAYLVELNQVLAKHPPIHPLQQGFEPIADSDELLAVLPGSRMAEINHCGPVFIQAVQRLWQAKPNLKVVTPLPNLELLRAFHQLCQNTLPARWAQRWHLIEGHSHAAMGAARAVLLASGTATLEAMMLQKPMVIAYKMPWLSYQWMKGKAYLPHVGLPNILANASMVPELIQHDASPEQLATATLKQLDDETNRFHLQQCFAEITDGLRRPSGKLAAEVLERWL